MFSFTNIVTKIPMISAYFHMLKSLLWLLFAAAIINCGFCNGGRSNFTGSCIQIERQALLEFKGNLTDPSNRLASWNHTGADCCTWYGIVCHKVTGHVLELHLRSISYDDYLDFSTTPRYESYLNLLFGGKVGTSLLELKHLRYLDLSNNDFGGIHIAKFLGSLRSLRYLNLSSSGFSRKIPHQLGNLSNLQYLDLSNNDFGRIHIPKFLGSLRSLRYLKLSSLGFSGKIPHQLGNLSNLQYLDLGYNFCTEDNLHWLSGVSSLKFLGLSSVELFNASNWLKNVNTLPSLKELHLYDCSLPDAKTDPLFNVNFSSLSILDLSENLLTEYSYLSWISQLQSLISLNLMWNRFQGPIPNYLQNLTSIRKLDLSGNNFNSSIPKWLYGFRYLEILDLEANQLLQGDISSGFGNMTSLVTLNLVGTGLQGGLPPSFKNLCNLRTLSLSGIKIGKEVSEVLQNLDGCASNGLESLDLSYCQLSGHLTHHLGQFKALEELDLGYNSLSDPIPPCLGELKSLRGLYFSYNNLSGTLPVNFGGLSKLELVDISHNSLTGDVFEIHFVNLTKLSHLDASGNQLRLRVSSRWSPPFQKMETLSLNSWLIGPQFPSWLGSLKYLYHLDLSNTRISSSIPLWFWRFSTELQDVDLSYNKIEGVLPTKFDTFQLVSLDLSANLLEGPLPSISSSVKYLDLSNNSLSGSLSNLLCSDIRRTNYLSYLILDTNLLQGKIPDCWKDWGKLELLELSSNRFHGQIPKSIGTLHALRSLHLRDNNISEKLPFSFRNCRALVTLDLSKNQLIGVIPKWIGKSFLDIVYLNFRENNFHGQIPGELCHLTSLQILDLAGNYFSGLIPNCLKNFSAMVTGDVSSRFTYFYNVDWSTFMDEAYVMKKGKLVEYSTIFNLVMSLDLSNNKLSGEIPKLITSLTGLQSLNLSHNILSGRIPEDIGAMKSLESMDFSQNQLFGEIPQSLANLNFLSYLNLSINNLSGRIPSGTQIQGFDSSSFDGNKELCGKPLPNNCSEDGIASLEAPTKASNSLQVDWFYVSMSIGFVVGLWGVLGPLVFNKQWRYEYFIFLDRLRDKIYWSFH